MYSTTVATTDNHGHSASLAFPSDRDIRDARQHFDGMASTLRTELADKRLTSYSIVTVEDDDVLSMESGFYRAELDMWCVVTMGASHEGDLSPVVRMGATGVHYDEVPATT